MKVRDIAPYGVRMSAELKEKVQERAKRNGRSMNSEIVQILEDAINEKVNEPSLLEKECNIPLSEIQLLYIINKVKESILKQITSDYHMLPRDQKEN